ncbi:NADH:flavin oxidoreductase [Desulfonema ishimotonii]|uniref:NADH:flavin oxidoreductase n=1 Tax=Desulfonema ishimotonii TaxID=45657 RepID=A0A401G1S9_9BACT|nr:NADH:flavin oxidoreductase [Desulfonema ishimotonii]GBC63171.1 NADH:flavin oxidoreductase [Desulfonema ishimotonii]
MSNLFESSQISGMTLANRFVRSATWEGMAADDGAVTPGLTDTMTDLARGGVGLIITGHAFVRPEGQAGPWQLGVYKDELVGGLREMSAAVHDCGGKIVMQLAHAGHFAAEKLTGQPPMVASDSEGLAQSPRREMTTDDIRALVTAFGTAARRAKAAGFDGVQIHSAHGYLLSQFLSPAFNRRQDEYGGHIRNRARIHLEVLRAIRKAVGDDFPVMIKMNCRDFAEGGLTLEDSLAAARMLAAAGLDAIELSGGLLTGGRLSPSRMGIKSPDREAYFREEARAFKAEISIPLILVGGMRSFEVAGQMVEEGRADYISMCRPLIREPDLIRRWKSGDRRRAECISDNQCFKPGMEGKGVYCVTRERGKRR